MADRSVTMRFRAEISDYVNKTRQMAGETRKFSGQLAQAAKAGKLDAVSHGATVAGAALLGTAAIAVKYAADFDSAMSKVSAATHASSADMGKLREAAIQAGADTVFSASEAAQAEEELAKAGVSVTDIIHGGLTGALDLASAGELSVGEAAETAATAMTQFNLAGSQIPHVADLLAAGAGKAQGDVHDMALALKQSGLVASQFGLSIEETTGTLAAFASAGLIGSDAGTSFKQMLLQLANPSTQAASAMQQLGIHAYTDQGAFVGLSNLAGQLHDKLGNLTAAERQHALAVIFGSDAIRSATVLYNDGAKGINAWEKKVNDAGYASDTAARKMDNLGGDVERLRGSLETDLIKAGSGANSVLRVFAQTADTAVDSFGRLPTAVTGTVTVLGGLTGGALLAAGAFGSIAPKIAAARAELEALGAGGKRASAVLGGLGKAGAVGAAVVVGLGLAATGANALEKAFTKARPSVGDLARSMQQLADTGKVTGAALTLVGSNGEKLAADIDTLNVKGLDRAAASMDQWKLSVIHALGFNTDLGNSYSAATKDIQQLDKALASMVQGGYADQAQRALVELAEKSGVSLSELRKRFPEMNAALKQMADNSERAGGPMDDLTKSMDGNALSAQAAADAVQNFSDQLHSLNDDNLSAMKATDAFQKSLKDLKKSVDDNGKSFKGNSDKALNNRDALYRAVDAALAMYDAEAKLRPGTDAAAKSLDRSRQSLIDLLTPYFNSRKAAQQFVDTVLRIPAKKATKISAPGAGSAKASVDSFINRANAIPRSKTMTVYIHYLTDGKNGGGGTHGKTGGLPSLLDPNRWGGIHTFATGGIYEPAGANGLYRFAEPETGGEALVPRLGNPGRSRAILDTAAGWYGGTIAWPGSRAGASAAASAAGPITIENHIEVGGEVVRIVRTEITESNRQTRRGATAGQRR